MTLTDADAAELQQLSPEERASWDAAISYYKDFLVNRDLLFDNYMVAIKNQLGDAESSSDLLSVPAELKKALLKAAPVYRKHWWPNHDSRNRQWILELKPLLHKYGSGISMALVTIYDESWPQRPVRVDAVAYANWAGAYTTIEPTRPTISTTDPANQGVAALEIVFHETSHGMVDKVADSIRAAERNVNALHPGRDFSSGSLWHAVLFYTAGELVAERVSGYIPYADQNGLWTRAWPNPDRSFIEQDWKPHMNGSVPLPSALSKLVADLAMESLKREQKTQ